MRFFALTIALLLASPAFAGVIKDTQKPVQIYTGTNTTPTINAATSGAVTLQPTGSTQTATVNGKLSATGGILGAADNSAPCAGCAGEVQECTGATSALATLTYGSVCSVTLTPGTWDISGAILVSGTTGLSAYNAAISTTQNSASGVVDAKSFVQVLGAGGTNVTATVTPFRVYLPTTTTYWLNGRPIGNGNPVVGNGFMHANRPR